MKNRSVWRFSIDVGGTFTDAIALGPDGDQKWGKVLSSAVTKGTISAADAANRLYDVNRIGDGVDFWNRYDIELFNPDGRSLLTTTVESFDNLQGCFTLQHGGREPVPSALDDGPVNYELRGGESAPLLIIRKILQAGLADELPLMSVRLGTTRGTNALLTRSGCPTALVTTRGFGDVLEIGEQNRPHLFKLAVVKHATLYQQSIEIDERVLHDGTIRAAPNEETVTNQLKELRDAGIESLAICFLHGYRYPHHENLVGDIARRIGFTEVSLSSEVAPLIKMIPRGETTVLNAYLNPVLRQYLIDFSDRLHPGSRLRLMTSSGGLVPPGRFGGKESILSGPAGGVVGFSQVARRLGYGESIGFDMGGTSTDVARFDGNYERSYESFKAGVRIVAPMMAIETIAAGGGSICWFDGTRLRVGPDSAGADPGPACYGRGGPLTVTDLNLFLGRLIEDRFPFRLQRDKVLILLDELRQAVAEASAIQYTREQLAEGLLAVAISNIAAAVRKVSVARGFDPSRYVLVAYGGAASQHACRVADQLGITKVISHPLAGILSAVGISEAVPSFNKSESFRKSLKDAIRGSELNERFTRLRQIAAKKLRNEGVPDESIDFRVLLDLQYRGTQTAITVEANPIDQIQAQFEQQHHREFGYLMDRPIEICAARIEAVGKPTVDENTTGADGINKQVEKWCRDLDHARAAKKYDEADEIRAKISEAGFIDRDTRNPHSQKQPPISSKTAEPIGHMLWTAGGESLDVAVFDRDELNAATQIAGPAIVFDDFSSVVIEFGWNGRLLKDGTLLLEQARSIGTNSQSMPSANLAGQANPVQLEIFNNHFTSIAEQMGEMLRRTAVSVNVKERLDFSCAIFTRTGDLVVNAPHVPVHLGAMSETVRATIRLNDKIYPGDVFVSNDPMRGGSHLPDITVITPVFGGSENELIFFVASRCHHAEIGGVTSGSMPPEATRLIEEGVLISNFKLVDHGSDRFEDLRELLLSGPYPSRAPNENIADITAQVAANQRGVNELLKLVNQYSLHVVLQYMEHIQQAAEQKTRLALANLPDIDTRFTDALDCGAKISARVLKRSDELVIDFSGTDPVLPNNLNANRAITTAAVLYCLRCLIDEDIPLNEGILRPVSLILPDCLINPPIVFDPHEAPAVSAGNVETSQRIVDVILGGLGLAAASQGTMNNLLLGDESFGYYETICGGTGAVSDADGCDAVHSHMTNTRLTDPEILESQFPVILRQFSIRTGSGGSGQRKGGNGVIRELEFLKTLEVSLLTNRRTTRPYGVHGGQPGAAGSNRLFVASGGPPQDLGYQRRVTVHAGDRIRIETPGGGGWGKLSSE